MKVIQAYLVFYDDKFNKTVYSRVLHECQNGIWVFENLIVSVEFAKKILSLP